MTAYGTSKAALNYFTKAINRQECANGIRINILSPGVVMTPIMTQFVNVQKTGKAEIDETLQVNNFLKTTDVYTGRLMWSRTWVGLT